MVVDNPMARILGVVLVIAGCSGEGFGPNLVTGQSETELPSFNDPFDDTTSISDWLVRSEAEGEASDGDFLIEGGQLLLRPLQDRYFLDDHRGLSLFKTIDTNDIPNFMVETRVTAVERVDGGPPTEAFHSAGLVVYPDTARMSDWVVANIGMQAQSLGFEDKSTIDDQSMLTLYDVGELTGVVRLCVVDQVITVFTRLASQSTWVQRNSFTHTVGPVAGAGVMINDYLLGTELVEGRFDYVNFSEIEGAGDCSI